ncbi:MAG TPA: DUF819 family protein, partial [Cyclobacteriaceae bacterium]|nr:DUF819 family protein [Cyclobacteriaceae bacterium]
MIITLTLVMLVLPWYLVKLGKLLGASKVLSDIVICYAVGMLLGNTRQWWLPLFSNQKIETQLMQESFSSVELIAYLAVMLAIPLLLMVNNLSDWIKYTGKITLVFFLGVISSISTSLFLGYLYKNQLADANIVSGMLAGVYIGGTPNMVAVSKALEAGDELFIILNATDTVCSALYFFFLISIGKLFLLKLLGPFRGAKRDENISFYEQHHDQQYFFPKPITWQKVWPILTAIFVALLAVGLSFMPAQLIPNAKGELNQAILMLSLSTLGIAFSFSTYLRTLPGVFGFAQYLLLIFGLSAGFITDFSQLTEVAGHYFLFNALMLTVMVLMHLFLSKIFKSDADSFMISSIALTMGPPFVTQMAAVLNNRSLLPAGIALA